MPESPNDLSLQSSRSVFTCFDEKVEAAAKTLEPAVVLDTSHMQIEEGFVSAWVQEAHDWLSAFYDFLELRGVEMPMSS